MQEAPLTEASAAQARERLVAFAGEMAAGLAHPRQRENALIYVRGLIEHGGRKSLQPTLQRLGEDAARYESVQQFLADSPWDARLLVRACAERVAPELAVAAWVVDDTGVVKDGRHSPGVKRQYSGTLGKVGNCQVTVSLHAAGERGTLPLGWTLYLPEEWCADAPRRRKAKIPEAVDFQTKPQLAAALATAAAGWEAPRAPILADAAYGDNTAFRTLVCRRTAGGGRVRGRFACLRVVAAHPVERDHQPPRVEWLIIEWPAHEEAPIDYWLSNLPEGVAPGRLARLARLRWTIELDYRQLKGELGLDHYEGRSWLGWRHHTALVSAAHGFLTLERLRPKARRPA